jgi:hypothetical protein
MRGRPEGTTKLKKQPSAKGPVEMFTGEVYFDVIYKGEEPSRKDVSYCASYNRGLGCSGR